MPEIVGQTLETADGKRFIVKDVQYFPREEIGKANKTYLSGLREGLLVSVWIQAAVPLVTVRDGVVRLKVIEIDGKPIAGSTEISKALGITKTRVWSELKRV